MPQFPINLGDGRAFAKMYNKYLHEYFPLIDRKLMTNEEAGKMAYDKTILKIDETIKWKTIVDERLKASGLIDDTDMQKLCFITVRPNTKLISFFEFKEYCRTFFMSTRMSCYEYCYEQKGTTPRNYGNRIPYARYRGMA